MRAFADAWPVKAIVQQPVGRLDWGQIVDLLAKLDDPAARDWCAAATDAGGWNRNVRGSPPLASGQSVKA